MTSKQSSIYSMLKRVILFLKKFEEFFLTLQVMAGLLTELESNLSKIDILREQQATDITGLRVQKETFRKTALQKAVEISHAILLYARIAGNEVLANEMYYTETGLKTMSDNELDTTLSLIYKSAQFNQEQLVPYGVTAGKIADYKVAIDAFKLAIGSPKGGTISRKQSTDQLAVLFDDSITLVEKVDLMLDTFKFSNPALYAEYQNNRRIIYHSGSITLKCEVTDAATGLPLEGALVTFKLNGNAALEKITSKVGGFTIKSMDEGTYAVTVTRLGYVPQNLNVNVLDVELNTVKVAMEAN